MASHFDLQLVRGYQEIHDLFVDRFYNLKYVLYFFEAPKKLLSDLHHFLAYSTHCRLTSHWCHFASMNSNELWKNYFLIRGFFSLKIYA